jgi:tetratricopeptide (TPR) repeat protein
MNQQYIYRLLSGIFLCSVLLTLVSCNQSNPTDTTETSSSESKDGGNEGEYTSHISEEDESNPLELARRRAALRTIIRKGDYFQVKNDAEQAISYYEKAHEQLKDDPKIAIRLANAYLDVKRFSDAANVFTKLDIRQFDEPSKRKIITSIMLDGNRSDSAEIIQKLPFQKETKEYLLLVDSCSRKPEDCTKNIQASESKSHDVLSLKNAVK